MNIGIVGIGFLGGSLIKSLSKLEEVNKIVACDKSEESLKQALSDGTISEYTLEIDEKFANCDIVFICTPVSLISEYAEKLSKVVKKDCIITDTGSTKKSILEKSKTLDIEFIGGHPMIGSERSGYATSKELLFENSYYIITKSDKNKQESIEKLKSLILKINAIPIIIDADKHDYITATISHVPHIIASSLVRLVKNLDDEKETMKTLAAGGFKDITRIASSDPIMWENICRENKDEILKILSNLENIIMDFKTNIENSDETYNFFDTSKKYRDSFISKEIDGNTMPELNVCIKDENGSIAKVVNVLSDNNIGIKNIEVLNNRENNYGALKVVVKNYEEQELGYNVLKAQGYEITKL